MSTLLPGIPESKDNGETLPSGDGGATPGEALSKFDFAHLESGSRPAVGPQDSDQSEAHAALASMSSDDALDYAIDHLGAADHLDAGHSDAGHVDPVDTSHDA